MNHLHVCSYAWLRYAMIIDRILRKVQGQGQVTIAVFTTHYIWYPIWYQIWYQIGNQIGYQILYQTFSSKQLSQKIFSPK